MFNWIYLYWLIILFICDALWGGRALDCRWITRALLPCRRWLSVSAKDADGWTLPSPTTTGMSCPKSTRTTNTVSRLAPRKTAPKHRSFHLKMAPVWRGGSPEPPPHQQQQQNHSIDCLFYLYAVCSLSFPGRLRRRAVRRWRCQEEIGTQRQIQAGGLREPLRRRVVEPESPRRSRHTQNGPTHSGRSQTACCWKSARSCRSKKSLRTGTPTNWTNHNPAIHRRAMTNNDQWFARFSPQREPTSGEPNLDLVLAVNRRCRKPERRLPPAGLNLLSLLQLKRIPEVIWMNFFLKKYLLVILVLGLRFN